MELIHERTLKAMDEMSKRFFWMNKKIDRMKSVMTVKFVMPQLAEFIHLELSHKYPLLADEVNDVQEMFNYDANYLGVEGATEDYSSIIEMMNVLCKWTEETNTMINELISIAQEEKDFNVYWKIGHLSVKYSDYVANAILLRDMAMLYDGNDHAMSHDSEEWWKL